VVSGPSAGSLQETGYLAEISRTVDLEPIDESRFLLGNHRLGASRLGAASWHSSTQSAGSGGAANPPS
jgi:hypothetical protein